MPGLGVLARTSSDLRVAPCAMVSSQTQDNGLKRNGLLHLRNPLWGSGRGRRYLALVAVEECRILLFSQKQLSKTSSWLY